LDTPLNFLLLCRPKHKHIVLPSWVDECVDEETLMNEDGESGCGERGERGEQRAKCTKSS
jgi:hypothetical protein